MMRIIEVQPRSDYRLWMPFHGGTPGEYDVAAKERGGECLGLIDEQTFCADLDRATSGCHPRPGRIDLCPTAMRRALMQG